MSTPIRKYKDVIEGKQSMDKKIQDLTDIELKSLLDKSIEKLDKDHPSIDILEKYTPEARLKQVIEGILSTILKGHFYAYYIPLAILAGLAVLAVGFVWLARYVGVLNV